MREAEKQGVLGIAFESLSSNSSPEGKEGSLSSISSPEGKEGNGVGCPVDLDILMEWFGQVECQKAEYGRYVGAIASLARTCAEAGIETMVFKGYGLSLNWPVPEHRPIGDIDTYHFGRWREADKRVAEKGVAVDYSHHHHSVYEWMGQAVENHYDIVNRYASKMGAAEDDLLKEMAARHRREVTVMGERVFLPSATFNGLFLLTHTAAHFSGSHITLRHLLDWAFFVDKDWEDVDWSWVTAQVERMGQLRFMSCIDALCVDYLGIAAEKFPPLARDEALEKRVLEDVMRPSFGESGSGFCFMLRRLKANMWKRNLVAAEPLVPRLVRLAWSHVLRPEWKL